MLATECLEKSNYDKLIGVAYSVTDCQALMERILHRAGVDSPNWRGSNHMWRDALSEKMPIDKMVEKYGQIVPGCWLFTVKNDGGEKKRGYNDDEGNAAHVGWYLGNGKVIHSTSGGVQYDTVDSPRWSHAGLCRLLEYPETLDTVEKNVDNLKQEIMQVLSKY